MVADVDVLPLEREPLFDGGDLLGLICPELGVAPRMDPGTDVEDERSTPVGSPSPVMDGTVPLPVPSGVDMELAQIFLEVGVLPAMVTPVVEPEGESAMTPASYPVPPIPELSVMVTDTLEAASPAGLAVGSPATDESLLAQISPSGSVVQAVSSPKLPVLRLAPMDPGHGPISALECFAAGGGVSGFPFASGSSASSSDDCGAACLWVRCVFPDWGDGCGWGPPENARFVSRGPL